MRVLHRTTATPRSSSIGVRRWGPVAIVLLVAGCHMGSPASQGTASQSASAPAQAIDWRHDWGGQITALLPVGIDGVEAAARLREAGLHVWPPKSSEPPDEIIASYRRQSGLFVSFVHTATVKLDSKGRVASVSTKTDGIGL